MRDLIDRNVVILKVREFIGNPTYDELMLVNDLNALPSRKKGKWVLRKDEDCWECSECHAVLENSDIGNHNFYYCYHCGADMMDICGYMDLEKANYE